MLAMRFLILISALVLASGCDCGGTPSGTCDSDGQCPAGERGLDGGCVPREDAGESADAAIDPPDARAPDASGPACGADGSCEGDARCVGGHCVPYGPGETDETCRRTPSPGPVLPQIQCAFEATPDGDPHPGVVRALHTPLVADLRIAAPGVPSRPSVVYVADYGYREDVPRGCTASGLLRILDGATCRSQAAFADVPLNSPVTPAIGDLDGDGTPEIVAAATAGGLAAFRVASDGAVTHAWSTTLSDGSADLWGSTQCQWGAVSIYDLDDDGSPEILFEGAVWDASGVRVTTLPGWVHITHGAPLPVGDFDGDGRVEAVAGNATWEYDAAARTFNIESGFSTTVPAGFPAIADLGEFPAVAGDAPGLPEVVSTVGGTVYVRTLSGGLIEALPTSTSGLAEKDLNLALNLGAATGVDLPLAEIALRDLAAGLGVPHSSPKTKE